MSSSTSEQPGHRAWIQSARIQSDQADLAAAQIGVATDGAALLAADYFPGYELQREIHRGAQGAVYRAVQKSTGRPVALKLLHDHAFGGPLERARFEREMHILAALQHPNIVAIHDGGSHAGRSFLVMDYIAGQPLDVYMAGQPRSIRETLALFIAICDAVNAAHVRGIIHRDLKPANVRVDASGRPFVLDFGLAKITADASDNAGRAAPQAMTLTGQFLGSLHWAAPEQAAGSPSRIDIRTDVYSLGVLLYHMLTGAFPYPVLGAMKDTLEAILHRSPESPRARRREVDNELETILLKCLQKEPARRYQSAGELARELQHYLAGEPIEAKRDSPLYVLRKGLRRHWPMAVASGALLVAILAGLATSLALWHTAATQRDLALAAEHQQGIERARAEAESRKLRHVNRFVQNMLVSADPAASPSGDVSARSLLDNAAREIESGELRDQPEVEAAARLMLGRAYTTLGLYDIARRQLETALQLREAQHIQDDAWLGETLLALARVQDATDDWESAESSARRALALLQSASGDATAEVASAWETLAHILYAARRFDESVAALREALAVWRAAFGDEHRHTASCMVKLATQLHGSDESETLLTDALRIFEQTGSGRSLQAAGMLSNLARAQHLRRDYVAAERSYLRSIEIQREKIGGPNVKVLNELDSLVLLYEHAGNWPRALETGLDLLEESRALRPGDSLRTAHALLHVSAMRARLQQNEPAVAAGREALAMLKRTGEDQTARGADARVNLAVLSLKCADLDTAEQAARECLEIADETLPGKTWLKTTSKSILGEVLTERRQFEAAEAWLTSSLAEFSGYPDLRSTHRETAVRRIVKLYEAWGKAELAEEWRHKLPPTNP